MRNKIQRLVTDQAVNEFWGWADRKVGIEWIADNKAVHQVRTPIYLVVYNQTRRVGVQGQIYANLRYRPFYWLRD